MRQKEEELRKREEKRSKEKDEEKGWAYKERRGRTHTPFCPTTRLQPWETNTLGSGKVWPTAKRV